MDWAVRLIDELAGGFSGNPDGEATLKDEEAGRTVDFNNELPWELSEAPDRVCTKSRNACSAPVLRSPCDCGTAELQFPVDIEEDELPARTEVVAAF